MVRNSFSLEESYKKWEKTQKDNTNKQTNITPNLKTSDRHNSLPNVDKEGFQYPKNPVKINSGITLQTAPADTANQYQVLDTDERIINSGKETDTMETDHGTDETNEQLKTTHDTSVSHPRTQRQQMLKHTDHLPSSYKMGATTKKQSTPVQKVPTRDKFKCANCGKNGHPASYAGCRFMKFKKISRNQARTQKNKSLERNIEAIYREVTPQNSYANAMRPSRDPFPPLKHRNQTNFQPFQGGPPPPPATENTRSQAYRLQPEYHQQQSQWPRDENPQQQNWANITNQISELTNVIKEMIMNNKPTVDNETSETSEPQGILTTLKFMAINANSLQHNVRRFELHNRLEQYNPDIVLISETKLNSSHYILSHKYKVIRTDRPNSKQGGGTAILIKNHIKHQVIRYPSSLKNETLEFTIIQLLQNTDSNKKIFIISSYATNSNRKTFIQELDDKYAMFYNV
ncbi:hypothetical protein KQX54_018408 [Cotesia glomerata]|uniref:Endonuclease/exonuclease/phosphatase domain-containing protein n=1 Tax=Cotesia glomerata TaxID=32391 RepID=A0AAV7ITG7_COTGL|nr:hypothetical protein KQX54_018408 [Cotesia glomerata]